ncbi:hypothetical protein SFRURICE_008282 [Spodoptera frugiperda]|nr:hypothetical protein SFRURICE_008282 [Spodoptera frugiperda]
MKVKQFREQRVKFPKKSRILRPGEVISLAGFLPNCCSLGFSIRLNSHSLTRPIENCEGKSFRYVASTVFCEVSFRAEIRTPLRLSATVYPLTLIHSVPASEWGFQSENNASNVHLAAVNKSSLICGSNNGLTQVV